MIRAGKIAATHGLQGTLIFTHITGNGTWLQKGHILFLALQKGSRIPYFVSQVKSAGAGEYHIQLEDIDNLEVAKKLVGKEVFVEEELLGPATKDSPLLWIGFELVDRNKGSLGPITDVLQTGHQWLGTIRYGDKEVLIPLIPQMILEINTRNRFIRMELPDGLLEL